MSGGINHADYRAARRFAGLDGLRCLAITGVIWTHCPHPDFLPIFDKGRYGVDLFFVLSGFLIVTLLLREKAETGRIALGNFWARRALRLFPAYYFLLFALLAKRLIFDPGDGETQALLDAFPSYALYLSNWTETQYFELGPMWSLATEEQFYLIWPVIEALLAPLRLAAWVVLVGLNQLMNFGLFDPWLSSALGTNDLSNVHITETTFTPILLGVGLAHILHRPAWYSRASAVVGFRHAPLVYALAIIALLFAPGASLSPPLRLMLHLAMALWVASIVVTPSSRTARALEWRPVAFIGAISYGMYLYHLFVIQRVAMLMERMGLPETPFVFLAGFALTVAVATVSFHLLEKPCLRLRDYFRGNRRYLRNQIDPRRVIAEVEAGK